MNDKENISDKDIADLKFMNEDIQTKIEELEYSLEKVQRWSILFYALLPLAIILFLLSLR